MNTFLAELRRRKVFRVAAVYLVTAWFVMQVVDVAMSALDLPSWFDGAVFVLLAIGFPIGLVMAWAFELTPDGVRRSDSTGESAALAPFAHTDAILIVALVAVLGVALFQVVRPGDGEPVTPGATLAADDLSIAVLPFADMSPANDQEYFADGLSEELLNVLAQIPDLRVAGRTSSFSFKGRNEDLRVIGDQLQVANILEGSVRKDGERLRITAQLVSSEDGYRLWSQTFNRQLDDVFAVQEEIAAAVADALSIALGVGKIVAAPSLTENLEAYDLYLRARALFNRGEPADLERAAELYRDVLARDPDYAPARSGLAETLDWMLIYIPENRDEALRELEYTVSDALARAPDHWATHFASALLHSQRHEWTEVDRALARAAELAPASDSVVTELRAQFFLHVGRTEEAIPIAQASMRIDPLSLRGTTILQTALDMTGRPEEAEIEYQRSLDVPGSLEEIEHNAMIRVWNSGDSELIRSRFDWYLQNQTLPTPLFAAVRDVFADTDAALNLLRAGFDDPANQDPSRQMLIGLYAAHYGDAALALAAMRRAFVDMGGRAILLVWYPDMAMTRRSPGFKELVRDLGLVDYWRETRIWGDFCQPVGQDDFECF